jgi:hypothetical protein
MLNTVTCYWNDKAIFVGSASAVMTYQIAELMASEFSGETKEKALRAIHRAIDLSGDLSKPLPCATIRIEDETGAAEMRVN